MIKKSLSSVLVYHARLHPINPCSQFMRPWQNGGTQNPLKLFRQFKAVDWLVPYHVCDAENTYLNSRLFSKSSLRLQDKLFTLV